MNRWRLVVLLSAALLPNLRATPSALAQAAPDDDSVSEARALFLAGKAAFEEGRYDTALGYFQASFDQSERPALLYNIAQCHDRLRQDEQAVAAFEKYLELAPDAPSTRSIAENRLRVLRAAIAEREAARTPDAGTTPSARESADAPTDSGRRVARWLAPATALGGVVIAAGGTALMITGRNHADDVENARVGSSYPSLRDELHQAEREWRAGGALVGVGAVALGGGLVWWWADRRLGSVDVRTSLTARGLHVTGRF
jgi:tetratricopeptide (TPR) repeat protein